MTCNSAPDVISGFTIVRNAVTLDYPIVPAIRSILELCDEVVVNVGQSDDDTRDVVAGLGDPRVRIIDSVWDFSHGSGALAHETNRAMAACRGAWGVYVQADEVLHEVGAAALREKIREWDGEARDRKSTRLNSSHSQISYAVFCLKKKKRKSNTGDSPYSEELTTSPA